MKQIRSPGRTKLLLWMRTSGVTQASIAHSLSRSVGLTLSQAAVSRWCLGSARPEPEFRHAIAVLTGGRIQPRDWETQKEKKYSQPVPRRAT